MSGEAGLSDSVTQGIKATRSAGQVSTKQTDGIISTQHDIDRPRRFHVARGSKNNTHTSDKPSANHRISKLRDAKRPKSCQNTFQAPVRIHPYPSRTQFYPRGFTSSSLHFSSRKLRKRLSLVNRPANRSVVFGVPFKPTPNRLPAQKTSHPYQPLWLLVQTKAVIFVSSWVL